MHHAITAFFHWPDGSVWGNVIVDALFALPAWAIAMWRFEVRHRRHQAAIHNQITQLLANNESND